MSYLTVITGTMKGGKSEELIHRIQDAMENSHSVLILKPSVDTRDGDKVASRATKKTFEAILVDEKERMMTTLILQGLKYFNEVFIDEAQFFSMDFMKAVSDECLHHGVDLTISGLMYDFLDRPFPSMDFLYDYADETFFYQADCDECKMKEHATKNVRMINGVVQQVGNAIAVEDDGLEYLTVCQSCFKKLIAK